MCRRGGVWVSDACSTAVADINQIMSCARELVVFEIFYVLLVT
jgi:hypothetical protein